jgi:hypothetical protein
MLQAPSATRGVMSVNDVLPYVQIVGTVFTTGGVLLALFGNRQNTARYLAERQELEAERADTAAAQARLVILTFQGWEPAPTPDGDPPATFERVVFDVENKSKEPIFDVKVGEIFTDYEPRSGNDVTTQSSKEMKAVLDAGAVHRIWTLVYDGNVVVKPNLVTPSVMFTDAAGLTWTRSPTQQPKRYVHTTEIEDQHLS